MLQKRAVYAAAEVLLQLHDTDASECAFILQGQEAAAVPLFHGHFGHDRNTAAGRNHGKNRGELATLEYDIRLQTCPAACGQGVLAETVALFEKKKRVVFDLCEMDSRQPS